METQKQNALAEMHKIVSGYNYQNPNIEVGENAAIKEQAAPVVSQPAVSVTETPVQTDPAVAPAAAKEPVEPDYETQGLHPVLEKLSSECERLGASDIFISTGFPPSFKINGELTPTSFPVLSPADAKKLVYSTLTAIQRKRFLEELELNYAVSSR
ncbi:MAG: hypothetical protein IKN18_00615, partial [Neisseriaceae bacterium]|nr:hypothetical protein [Neisseriaceae bacterium]